MATMRSTGVNTARQLGLGDTTQRTSFTDAPDAFVYVSMGKHGTAGSNFAAGIKADGTLWAWGANSSGQLGQGDTATYTTLVQIGSATNWRTVHCGESYVFAIKRDGTLWAWGNNTDGQLGLGHLTTPITSPTQVGSDSNWADVSCGNTSTVARKLNGTVWSCGSNGFFRLGRSTNTLLVDPSFGQVGSGTVWTKIAYGYQAHCLLLDSTGQVWSFGYGANGRLGHGNTSDQSSPVAISSLTSCIDIAAGSNHSYVVKSDGTLWGFGGGANGALGQGSGDTTDKTSPVQIGSATNWLRCEAGNGCGFFRNTSGDLYHTGSGSNGRTGNNGTSNTFNTTLNPSYSGAVGQISPGGASALTLTNDPATYPLEDPASIVAPITITVESPPPVVVVAPIEVTVIGDTGIAPITITVVNPTGTASAPITVSVIATGAASAPISIGVVDTLATTRWSAKVTLGGVDVSSQVLGTILVDAEEGAARIASFGYLPAAGVVNPTTWTGAAVTIDLLRIIGGASVPARVFTGVVDLATFDPSLRLVSFACTDDLQNRVAALTTAEIDTLCAGRYSAAVFGEIADKWDYAQDRMATRQASLDAGAHGGLRTTAWSGLSVYRTFTAADVLDQTPSVELPRRIEIINQIDATFEYRYHRCRERHASLAWNTTIIGAAPANVAYQQPTQGEIESALNGTGWHVVSSGFTPGWAYVTTATPSGETGTWYVDVPGDNQVGSMSAHLMQRHAQTVTETYSITVKASASITANGLLASPMRGALGSTWNPDAWESDPTILTPDASAGDVDYSTDAARADADAALLTLIDTAKTKILASHRQARVSFTVACLPEIDLTHAATLDWTHVTATGKVARTEHRFDIREGEATTRITLALSGVAAGGIISETTVAVPDAPAIALADDPWALTVPPLQNHYGAISGAVYNDALSGYFCNAPQTITVTDLTDSITEANAAYAAGTAYPFTGFKITMPGVADSHRNPLALDKADEYIVNIPADTFALEV